MLLSLFNDFSLKLFQVMYISEEYILHRLNLRVTSLV